jgi:hypothetical protein
MHLRCWYLLDLISDFQVRFLFTSFDFLLIFSFSEFLILAQGTLNVCKFPDFVLLVTSIISRKNGKF